MACGVPWMTCFCLPLAAPNAGPGVGGQGVVRVSLHEANLLEKGVGVEKALYQVLEGKKSRNWLPQRLAVTIRKCFLSAKALQDDGPRNAQCSSFVASFGERD